MSERFKLDTKEWVKIAKGAGIAAVGAILTYLTGAIPGIDFGSYTPIVVTCFAVVANAIRKALGINKK